VNASNRQEDKTMTDPDIGFDSKGVYPITEAGKQWIKDNVKNTRVTSRREWERIEARATKANLIPWYN
jgi:hypothetical protein